MGFQRMVAGFSYLIFGIVLYICANHLVERKNDQTSNFGTQLSCTEYEMAEPEWWDVDQEVPLLAEIPKFEWPKFKEKNTEKSHSIPRIVIQQEEEILEVDNNDQ